MEIQPEVDKDPENEAVKEEIPGHGRIGCVAVSPHKRIVESKNAG